MGGSRIVLHCMHVDVDRKGSPPSSRTSPGAIFNRESILNVTVESVRFKYWLVVVCQSVELLIAELHGNIVRLLTEFGDAGESVDLDTVKLFVKLDRSELSVNLDLDG